MTTSMFFPKTFRAFLPCVVCFLTFIREYETACTMELLKDKKGIDANTKYDIFTLSDLTACQNGCLGKDDCVAIRFTINCFYWSAQSDIVDFSGTDIYEKVCESETTTTATTTTTAASCSMQQSANTGADNYQVELSLGGYADCESACKSVSQCQRVAFDPSPATCKMYSSSSVATSSQSGSTVGTKKDCSDGKKCCFDSINDKSVSDASSISLTSSQSSCDDLCLAMDSCKASIFTGSSCKIFTQDPEPETATGVTLSTKNCPQGASGGSFTYDPTCESSAFSALPCLSVILSTLIAAVLMMM